MNTRTAAKSLVRFLKVEDQFYDGARQLRQHFDERFADPRQTSSQRFVWDYWYVPDQYCLHRTPAYHFFPRATYTPFHRALVQWGRENLGCYEISPPWLSYYIDGGEQHLHSDVPHGPWAFVFSLTNWKSRAFEGGETLMLRPETLSYWSQFHSRHSSQQGRELSSFVERIPAEFNRLTVFDPRFPHGVTRVSGVRDPRAGRIVLHGWFTKPEAYIVGGLTRRQATTALNVGIQKLQEGIPQHETWQGTLILRLKVNAAGRVTTFTTPTNSVVIDTQAIWDRALTTRVTAQIREAFRDLTFPRSKAETRMTIPLMFE